MNIFGGNKKQFETKFDKTINKLLMNGDTFEDMKQYSNLYIGKEYIYVDTHVIDATYKISDQKGIRETYRIKKDKIQSVYIEQKATKLLNICNLCIVTSGKTYKVLYNTGNVFDAYNDLAI